MRVLLLTIVALAAGCNRSPEQQQADRLIEDARARGAALEKRADLEADRLEAEAQGLGKQAKQAGGYTGKRIAVRADALSKEARIVREQAAMQADALKHAATAQGEAIKSR